MQILLVDDEEVILQSLSPVLTGEGHSVLPCTNAADALRALSGQPVDIVVSDLKMPGIDGLQLLRQVRAREPEVPVILITGHGDEDTAIDALQEGAFDYLRKPFRLRALLASIGRADESRRLTRQLREERQKLVHAQRLASIGTLAAGLAHEVNNPTTFIKANIELLERSWRAAGPILAAAAAAEPANVELQFAATETQDLLRGLGDGARRIERLVKDMGALARQEKVAAPRLSVDLRACVDDALKMTRGSLPEGTAVRLEQAASPVTVLADDQQITQVLMNLVHNAGHSIAGRPEPRLTLTTGVTDDWGWACVDDNGGGIPEAIRDRVFDPFFTTKAPGSGTGLGLAVCHGIIADHGGQIGFDDNEDGGARFWVRLPRTEPVDEER